MSDIAALLMVISGALCLAGGITAKSGLGAVASSLMLAAMVDLAYTMALPPVAWSGALLLVGLVLAASLRPAPASPVRQRTTPVPVGAAAVPVVRAEGTSVDESASREVPAPRGRDGVDRPALAALASQRPRLRLFPRLGRTAAVCSAITYPIMAWQVLNHGAHGGRHHAAASSGHGHHGHTVDPAAIHAIITAGVIVLAVLLVLCALQATTRRRWALTLECLGMATMISVMQFLH